MMKKRMRGNGSMTAIAAASLAALALAGCGGSGGGNNNSSPIQTIAPFAGSYAGTFTDTGHSQSGTITATVSPNGQVTTASLHNTTLNSDAQLTGFIDNSRNANVGDASFSVVNSSETFKGTVVFASNGHLAGNLTEYNGGTQIGMVVVDLIKQ